MTKPSVTLIMTGASGAHYGLRLLEELIKSGVQISLLISKPAQIVIKMETDVKLPGRAKEIEDFFRKRYQDDFKKSGAQLSVYEREQWMAPIASGSGVADVTVVCPCTTGTLSSIAVGASKNLLERAADVALKERKKLILVVRETPLSDIHLENMLKLSRMGVVIMPANPGFYHQPETLDDIINFMVARILDHIGIKQVLLPAWGE
jgi:4-hydroxy-3-polyprenylbenzoate decarboxylase